MNAELKACKRCSTIFRSLGRPVCYECLKEIDKLYPVVRDYMREHPGSSFIELIQNTDVDELAIRQFMQDGRLSFASPAGILKCASCDKTIDEGRYCNACKDRLSRAFNNAASSLSSTSQSGRSTSTQNDKTLRSGHPRMHTYDDN